MSELVTGEAVALELRPAKLPSRALAVLLDLAVAMVVYLFVSIVLVYSTGSLDDAAKIAVTIAASLLVLVGGPIAVETLSHGRSLGKLACGLRVVRDDGGPIRFRHALVRGAVGMVEILTTFGIVACIASLLSERGRRLGDVFAGTLVVRERVPAGRAHFVPPPPPWLAGRFSGLDLSAVPDGLWLAIRQYLTRMQQLDPRVGWEMAQRLAGDLAACTGTPAPQGVPAAAYLAAVVQERQAREVRRTSGGRQLTGSGPIAGGVPAGEYRGAGGAYPGSSPASSWPNGTPGGGGSAAVPPGGSPYPSAPAYSPPGAEGAGQGPAAGRFDAARPTPPADASLPDHQQQSPNRQDPQLQDRQAQPMQPEHPKQPDRPATGFAPPA
ncbi:RDD family protein [Streptomyces sp. NPDC058274]|uniref:RDD family protein n=1 Tax=Streptomyces sp. NPDC058274 TaxID=3346416 RepID=UPI0036E2EA90